MSASAPNPTAILPAVFSLRSWNVPVTAVEFSDAFNYSGADYHKWRGKVGSKRFENIYLAVPSSAAVACKVT